MPDRKWISRVLGGLLLPATLGVAVAVALLGYVGYGYYQLKTETPVAIASPIGWSANKPH